LAEADARFGKSGGDLFPGRLPGVFIGDQQHGLDKAKRRRTEQFGQLAAGIRRDQETKQIGAVAFPARAKIVGFGIVKQSFGHGITSSRVLK